MESPSLLFESLLPPDEGHHSGLVGYTRSTSPSTGPVLGLAHHEQPLLLPFHEAQLPINVLNNVRLFASHSLQWMGAALRVLH